MIIVNLLFTGCATTTIDGDVNDPLEKANRHIYAFNDVFDKAILKPAAQGFQKLPRPIQTGTHNFFSNLNDFIVIFNDILQFNIEHFTSDTLRLSFNTVFGVFGLIDVATPMGLPKHEKGFADTLGHWGVASGPYIVLPFFGPSSLRDAPALIVDFLVHPASLLSSTSAIIALASAQAVEIRSELFTTKEVIDRSFDPYIFTREGYYQWREDKIGSPTVTIEDLNDKNFEDEGF
ncbi:MAG: VacJ family lipoprotein [Gammaproteobacteria bacterium]|nr:VacJ family lipoprotein [Gammaproteobacteria bacterium]